MGRFPNTAGLTEVGIELDGRRVKVDEFGRTNLPGVYAIGDLTPGPQLAHVASAEGILAVEHAAGHAVRPIDYGKIPGATYTHPEVASVGLTEREAREKGYEVKVGRFPWAALGKAAIIGETEGLVKIVAEAKYGELLGVHIMGPSATDLIAEACVALQCEATVEELYRTIHAHPTQAEALKEAAHGVLGTPHPDIPPPRRKKEPGPAGPSSSSTGGWCSTGLWRSGWWLSIARTRWWEESTAAWARRPSRWAQPRLSSRRTWWRP